MPAKKTVLQKHSEVQQLGRVATSTKLSQPVRKKAEQRTRQTFLLLQDAFSFLLSPAMIKDRPPTEKLTPDKVPKLRGTTRASNEKLTQRSGKHIFSSISKIQQTSKNSQSTHVLFFVLPRKAKKKSESEKTKWNAISKKNLFLRQLFSQPAVMV